MTEVLVAIVTTGGLVITALLANRGRQHTKATRDQVQNSHATNLRDDFDAMKRQNETIIAKLDAHEHRLVRMERRRYWRLRWKDAP
jgi:hypothetical protein